MSEFEGTEMKGRGDEREDGLNMDEPFSSETMQTVRSSGDGWGVKELGEKNLKGCRPRERSFPTEAFCEGNTDAHLKFLTVIHTSASTSNWQTQWKRTHAAQSKGQREFVEDVPSGTVMRSFSRQVWLGPRHYDW